jgi:hypothetical protein
MKKLWLLFVLVLLPAALSAKEYSRILGLYVPNVVKTSTSDIYKRQLRSIFENIGMDILCQQELLIEGFTILNTSDEAVHRMLRPILLRIIALGYEPHQDSQEDNVLAYIYSSGDSFLVLYFVFDYSVLPLPTLLISKCTP